MKLTSLRIPKTKLTKKCKKIIYDEELSALKARNTILRSVAEVLVSDAGKWKSLQALVRHHSSFIKIKDRDETNLLIDHHDDESIEEQPHTPTIARLDLGSILEILQHSSSNKKDSLVTQSSLQSFINCVRKKPIDFLIHQLRKNQMTNQQRVSDLLSAVDKRRKQSLKEESFFCRHPSLMTAENRRMTLFINSVKEKNLVYNLKSSFPVEGKYLQIMEDYIKFNSKKQMLEYAGTGEIISTGQRQTGGFIRGHRVPSLQFGRLQRQEPDRLLFSKLTSSAMFQCTSIVTDSRRCQKAIGSATCVLVLGRRENTSDVLCATVEVGSCELLKFWARQLSSRSVMTNIITS
jgi:hypothetical protein